MVIRVVTSSLPTVSFVVYLVLSILALNAFPVLAVTAPSLPEIKKQQEDLLNKSKNDTLIDNLVDDLEVEKHQQKAEIAGSIVFLLRGVKITGNNVLTKEDVSPLIQPRINKQITANELKDMAAKLTLVLQSKGYKSSRAFVPPQQISGGIVEFQVEEDLLSNIHVLGKDSFKYEESLFYQYFSDLKGKIIHTPTLVERLKYLNFLPGTRIKPTLKKIEFGKSALVLVLEPVEDLTALAINNNASRYQGDLRTVFSTLVTNPSGRSDTFSLFAAINPEFPKYFSSMAASYSVPFGNKGAKLHVNMSKLDYQIDPDAIGQNLLLFSGSSDTVSLSYEKPFWLDVGSNSWTVGLEKRSATSQTTNNFPDPLVGNQIGFKWVDQSETLYALNASMQFVFSDQIIDQNYPAQNVVNIKVAKILEGVADGTTQEQIDYKELNNNNGIIPQKGPIGDTRDAVANFWKVYFSYYRRQTLPWNMTLNVQANIEWANFDNILSSYDYGGADTGTSGGDLSINIARNFVFEKYLDWMNLQLGFEQQISYNIFYPDRNRPLDRSVEACGGLTDLTPYTQYRCDASSPFLSTRLKRDNHLLSVKVRSRLQSFGVTEDKATVTYTYVF